MQSIVTSANSRGFDRPYRAGLPCDEAKQRLVAAAGTQWDERFVRLFLRLREQPSARVDGALPAGLHPSSAAYR